MSHRVEKWKIPEVKISIEGLQLEVTELEVIGDDVVDI